MIEKPNETMQVNKTDCGNKTDHANKLNNDCSFSERIMSVQPSFIREILKAAGDPNVISFAGGLPDKCLFPTEPLKECMQKVMQTEAESVLQYGGSEGEDSLRNYLSEYYQRYYHLHVPVENILITNGSQQGLDLLGKVLINKNDNVVIESPGYLGAIQSMAIYQPHFLPIPMEQDGMNVSQLKQGLKTPAKLLYCVPDFQNPTGYSYTIENKQAIAEAIEGSGCLIVEDNPYAMIRFTKTRLSTFYQWLPEQTIMLGSFSKTIAPGLRIGWVVAPDPMMRKLVIAKQAADLHTSRLSQRVITEYVRNYDFDDHVELVSSTYSKRAKLMGEVLDDHFGDRIKRSFPSGGMFMWTEFNDPIDTMRLAPIAARNGVVFVPGAAFYPDKGLCSDNLHPVSYPVAHPRDSYNSMRLNFSCASDEQILEGVRRLSQSVKEEREING